MVTIIEIACATLLCNKYIDPLLFKAGKLNWRSVSLALVCYALSFVFLIGDCSEGLLWTAGYVVLKSVSYLIQRKGIAWYNKSSYNEFVFILGTLLIACWFSSSVGLVDSDLSDLDRAKACLFMYLILVCPAADFVKWGLDEVVPEKKGSTLTIEGEEDYIPKAGKWIGITERVMF